MEKLEKNVYLDDVTVVFQSSINGDEADDLFLDRDEAIDFTKEAMNEYGLDGDAEDYIEEIDIDHTEGVRAATDENGKLIIEELDLDGEWRECKSIIA